MTPFNGGGMYSYFAPQGSFNGGMPMQGAPNNAPARPMPVPPIAYGLGRMPNNGAGVSSPAVGGYARWSPGMNAARFAPPAQPPMAAPAQSSVVPWGRMWRPMNQGMPMNGTPTNFQTGSSI